MKDFFDSIFKEPTFTEEQLKDLRDAGMIGNNLQSIPNPPEDKKDWTESNHRINKIIFNY